MEFVHTPVLLQECLSALVQNKGQDAIYVDGTLGGGGHTREILKSTQGQVFGIDRDRVAIEAATERLKEFMPRFTALHGNDIAMQELLQEAGVTQVDGILLDLGVSSPQLDEAQRGFSYRYDAPLDMRMDRGQALSAEEVVNTYSQEELTRILYAYGEEKWSARIAEFICKARPLHTTFELVEVIDRAIPKAVRQKTDGHSAKRTFQAIRIEVNGELRDLEETLETAVSLLKPQGRLCVITFHSLEDRIVKNTFRRLHDPCTCPPSAPICICGKKPQVDLVTKKPILPTEEEVKQNLRAHSAKLRVVSKLPAY